MHEMGIAESVLRAVRTEAVRYPGRRPCRVGLRIGELAAIDQEALRFCFEAIIHDTDLEALELDIQVCPRTHRCFACGNEFVVRDYEFQCPQCASLRSKCIAGDELEFVYLEVEENESSTVGAESTQ